MKFEPTNAENMDDLRARIQNMEEKHHQEMSHLAQRYDGQISALMKRLQLMELVFKSYYIDDEVFHRLHDAHCAEQESTETLTPNQDGIFSRFFRHRTRNTQDVGQDPHRASAARLLEK